jgi:cell division transport system permease protein
MGSLPATPSVRTRWLPQPDLPFEKEDAHRYMPWIVGLMSGLTLIALLAAIAFNAVLLSHIDEFSSRYQIQIPYDNGKELQTAEDVLAYLKRQKGIKNTHKLTQAELSELLMPWLGGDVELDMLPVPQIIDVWLADGSTNLNKGKASLTKLESRFSQITVEPFAQWIEQFNAAAQRIQVSLITLAALLLTATLIVVILVTRASVQLHFPIVKLLHRMGSEDHYISTQFLQNAILLTLKGLLPGIVTATIFAFTIGTWVDLKELVPAIDDLTMQYFYVVAGFPLLLLISVSISSYISVRRRLARLH